MRLSPVATCLAGVALCATLQASILPTLHLEASTLKVFEDYVTQFERNVVTPYEQSGKMWIDSDSCCRNMAAFAAGKFVVEPRENTDIAGGSIHHFSGAMHINGHTIEDVAHVMEDYPNYPKYFKPDVGKGSALLNPDSTPEDRHYTAHLTLVQTTVWMSVNYDSVYDTHYRMLDPHRWESISRSVSIKEWRDAKDVTKGYYPEGDDHGFVWRTNTFWFVRENNGGLDLAVDSMTLSRPNPTGLAWWGTRRTRDAVEKMLRDMKAALESPRS